MADSPLDQEQVATDGDHQQIAYDGDEAAAKAVGVKPRYIKHLRDTGRLPFVKVTDRKVLILHDDLDRVMRSNRVIRSTHGVGPAPEVGL